MTTNNANKIKYNFAIEVEKIRSTNICWSGN